MSFRRLLAALLAIGFLALLQGRAYADALDPCAPHIYREERNRGIPAHLMRAVALAESGRWLDEAHASVAWPWTINAEGVGQFFPSKAAAIAGVHALQARGVRSIDVGCMQVNLYWHANAFRSLEEAFEPMSNVAYAARYLTDLRQERGSWEGAVSYYHSAVPEFNQPYRAKVERLWASVKGNSTETQTRLAAVDVAGALSFRGPGIGGTAWWLKPGWVNPNPSASFTRVATNPGGGSQGMSLERYRHAPVQPATAMPTRFLGRP
ncbi:MAG: transglycosylase SLT domain-containing protein [Proteobacteria bacterium]|nr:transglycosylase SLT domain-containing protein [Pseudomonadota bacterium]MBI3507983.1 transglycosylase SLT domain-containing protein [Pseudomonadota bacterium]